MENILDSRLGSSLPHMKSVGKVGLGMCPGTQMILGFGKADKTGPWTSQ